MSTLCKKVFSGAPVKYFFFFWMNQITQILLFSRMTVLLRSKSTVWEGNLFKKNWYGSFGFVSTLCKKLFPEALIKCFSLYGSNNSDFIVFRMLVLQRSKITVWEQKLFKNKFVYGSFWFLSTLRKKVFSRAPVKCFFSYSSNNSDSVVLENGSFGDQRWQCENDTFLIIFPAVEVLCVYLTYIKVCFQWYQWNTFFFRAQITQILLFWRMPVLVRSEITV